MLTRPRLLGVPVGAGVAVAANSGDSWPLGSGPSGNGSAGGDYLNGGAGSDVLYAQAGNDTGNYSWQENLLSDGSTSTDLYNGGIGNDTLTLRLAHGEVAAAQAELDASDAFLAANANPNRSDGPTFSFTAFDPSAGNRENAEVVLVHLCWQPCVNNSG